MIVAVLKNQKWACMICQEQYMTESSEFSVIDKEIQEHLKEEHQRDLRMVCREEIKNNKNNLIINYTSPWLKREKYGQ